MRRDIFRAIADPTRRTVLTLLAVESLTAGAIASNFDSARPTISRHMLILTECELVKQEQKGREVYYHLNVEKMKELEDWLAPFRKLWDSRFTKLEKLLKEKMKSKRP